MNAPPRFCQSESAPVHLVIPNPLQRCQYTRPCTLSFRIRFSGEESAFPASRFQETRRAPCLATLSTWDSRSDRNGFVSGYAFRPPATDAPCRPAPIGRNCHRTETSSSAPPEKGAIHQWQKENIQVLQPLRPQSLSMTSLAAWATSKERC